MLHVRNKARAFVYSGDWVAECPGGCNGVEHLFEKTSMNPNAPRIKKKTSFHCSYCGHLSDIEWAADMEAITAVLSKRPIPYTRNWYPEGHDTAIRAGLADGQSVSDLMAENEEHGVK